MEHDAALRMPRGPVTRRRGRIVYRDSMQHPRPVVPPPDPWAAPPLVPSGGRRWATVRDFEAVQTEGETP